MGKETLEVTHIQEEDGSRSKVLFIPSTFRTGAIKEILTNIVWGESSRAVWILSHDEEEPDKIPNEELKSYRDLPRVDRQCQLDILTLRIKRAKIVTIIEEVRK